MNVQVPAVDAISSLNPGSPQSALRTVWQHFTIPACTSEALGLTVSQNQSRPDSPHLL